MSIDYAVIPVAGLGTRMRPASSAIPKEMITMVDRPVIDYIVQEAVDAGIKNIVLVTREGKSCIEDYLTDVGRFAHNVNFMMVRQKEALGLGNAIYAAQPIVRENSFTVLLPDVVTQTSSDLKDMIREYEAFGRMAVAVQEVPRDEVYKYGVVDVAETPERGEIVNIKGLVEKPAIEEAPSNLAIVGRYVLCKDIFYRLENIPMGAGGEIQLTDAIVESMGVYPYYAYRMKGETFDCGSKIGLLQATMHFAARHPLFGLDYRKIISKASKK